MLQHVIEQCCLNEEPFELAGEVLLHCVVGKMPNWMIEVALHCEVV